MERRRGAWVPVVVCIGIALAGAPLLAGPRVSRPPAPPETLPAPLARLAAIEAKLAPYPESEWFDDAVWDLPPAVPRLMDDLHEAFGDLVEGWLREHPAARSPEDVRAGVLAELARAGVVLETEEEAWDDGRRAAWFGRLSGVEVQAARGDPALLAVSWQVGLGLVDDGAVFVFTTDGGRVRRVLQWSAAQAGPAHAEPVNPSGPPQARDRINNLQVRLPPRGAADEVRVGLAWSQPGSPSRWGDVWWALLAAGPDPRAPRPIARDSSSAYQCGDECFRLELEGDELSLAFDGNAGTTAIVSGFTTRSDRHRWRFTAEGVETLGAPTDDPFAFVDAWISARWSDARGWGESTAAIRRWHEVLRREAESGGLALADRLWDRCPWEESRHQVIALDVMPTEEPTATVFLLMDTVDGQLRLVGVGTSRSQAEAWAPLRDCPADGA
jgi:hypothetical protein